MTASDGKTKNTAALLAAAGLSSRMGALKPLLPLGGETILRRGLKTLLGAGCSPVVVVVGREAERVGQSVSDLPVECVFNPDYASCQMFDSVRLGLERLAGRCDRLFFAPADVPLFSADTLDALLRAGDGVFCPTYRGKRGHPVLIPSRFISGILAYDGDRGLAGALEAVGGAAQVEVPDAGILLDADTQEDYRRLLSFGEDL